MSRTVIPEPEPSLMLYYHPYSFYTQKVVMALHQMQIRFKPVIIDIHRGTQYSKAFLAINPRGEVPVLVDDVRVVPDSEQIIDYLQDNFSNGTPGLLPYDRDIRTRVEQLHREIHDLKIEALSFGAALFDDLGTNPKPEFNCLTNRTMMKAYLSNRPQVLEREIANNPMYAEALRQKLNQIADETHFWSVRDDYEGLLIHIEKVMDECEAELASHDEPDWWLASPELSIADLDFAFLLYRLWQLGFERRMWERNRPLIKQYFARLQHLQSFKLAISMTEPANNNFKDFVTSPILLGLLGTAGVLAGGYYVWTKAGTHVSSAYSAIQSVFNDDGNSNHQDVPHINIPSYVHTPPNPLAPLRPYRPGSPFL